MEGGYRGKKEEGKWEQVSPLGFWFYLKFDSSEQAAAHPHFLVHTDYRNEKAYS